MPIYNQDDSSAPTSPFYQSFSTKTYSKCFFSAWQSTLHASEHHQAAHQLTSSSLLPCPMDGFVVFDNQPYMLLDTIPNLL